MHILKCSDTICIVQLLCSHAVLECSTSTLGKPSTAVLPQSVPVEFSRIMLLDDANPAGNVHGGVMLKLLEQAGEVVANRHCNQNNSESPVMATLVRVDHMDFHQPMFVGEVGQIQAAVTYASPRSVEVTVDAWAENMLRGHRRHTNAATLWYIATPVMEQVESMSDLRAVPIPPLTGLSSEEIEAGKRRYDAQKAARAQASKGNSFEFRYDSSNNSYTPEKHTVLASQNTLASIVLPSDCTVTGHLMGGSLMKKMDEAAAICSASHCGGVTVTACIDAIDFHSPIVCGEVVFVTARLTFTSSKSMEIEVIAEAEGLLAGSRRVTTTAYFTYVAIGEDRKASPVPPLLLRTDEEMERFKDGRERYEARRQAMKQS